MEDLNEGIKRYKERMTALRASFPRTLDHAGFFDYSIGPGWRPLVNDLLSRLEANEPAQPVDQVKQKFGELKVNPSVRFDAGVRERIDEVIKICAKTCENCGGTGRLQVDGGYYAVLCDACLKIPRGEPGRERW